MGAVWGALLPGGIGFLGLFLGGGLGYGIGESVSAATNRKAGTPLQVVAAVGACWPTWCATSWSGTAFCRRTTCSGTSQ